LSDEINYVQPEFSGVQLASCLELQLASSHSHTHLVVPWLLHCQRAQAYFLHKQSIHRARNIIRM
jgi:hypothetical protein